MALPFYNKTIHENTPGDLFKPVSGQELNRTLEKSIALKQFR